MSNIYETLVERGIIAQCTNEEKVKEILNNSNGPFYIGFDIILSYFALLLQDNNFVVADKYCYYFIPNKQLGRKTAP
mgnify:CR=1 FL=1